FCPLYVHSAVGLGKTHLLQAVAHAAASQGRSVIYLTAEKFMYGFVAFLEARVAAARSLQPNFELSPAVLAFVARSIRSNGRDLEGAVNRLLAHSTLTGAPLTVEAAEVAIRDLIRAHEPKRVKIEDIQRLVANHYSVSRADILSSRRTAVVVKPRQVAMFLAKTLTMRSLPEIGRRFGGRD